MDVDLNVVASLPGVLGFIVAALGALLLNMLANEGAAWAPDLGRWLIRRAAAWVDPEEQEDFLTELLDLIDCYQADGKNLSCLCLGIVEFQRTARARELGAWISITERQVTPALAGFFAAAWAGVMVGLWVDLGYGKWFGLSAGSWSGLCAASAVRREARRAPAIGRRRADMWSGVLARRSAGGRAAIGIEPLVGISSGLQNGLAWGAWHGVSAALMSGLWTGMMVHAVDMHIDTAQDLFDMIERQTRRARKLGERLRAHRTR